MNKVMKTRILLPMLAMLIFAGTSLMAQNSSKEYLGLPGDNLNLYAVMKIFQESKTLEGFEKALNDPNNKINNLDLNGDGYVDYITVNDFKKGNVHNIVLRDPINQNESQDVAVFTVKRYNNGQVKIQLTGDEALYGKDYIIEPNYFADNSGGTPNPGYIGDGSVIYTTPYLIADWPIISYIYTPGYTGWYSSWYWGYYPRWWNPWRPFYWDYYYGYNYNWYRDYAVHYHRCYTHFDNDWHNKYYVHTRVYSPVVAVNINSGHYRYTYQHPETRKEGENDYYRSQPEQGRRSTYSTVSSGNGVARTGQRKIGESETGRRTMSSVSTVTSSAVNREKSTNTINARRNNPNTITFERRSEPVNRNQERISVMRERPATTINRSYEPKIEKSENYQMRRPSGNSGGSSFSGERRASNVYRPAKSENKSEHIARNEFSGGSRRK
jgi:hypothetical protein